MVVPEVRRSFRPEAKHRETTNGFLVPIAELQLDIPIDSRQDAPMILFLQLRYESRREQR